MTIINKLVGEVHNQKNQKVGIIDDACIMFETVTPVADLLLEPNSTRCLEISGVFHPTDLFDPRELLHVNFESTDKQHLECDLEYLTYSAVTNRTYFILIGALTINAY